jgi:ketosteroid isomerase-like protein
MTSVQNPVTVFGAKVPLRHGWDEVSEVLRWLASRWSKCTDYRFDLVAAGASGDLAYLIGFEHIANSVAGVAVEPYTLRVTHVFRREQDEWKISHRHADYVPIDQTLSGRRIDQVGDYERGLARNGGSLGQHAPRCRREERRARARRKICVLRWRRRRHRGLLAMRRRPV